MSDTYRRIADSGNTVTSHACRKCSCIMWVHFESQPALRVIRAGTIDDADVLDTLAPSKELYCSQRSQCFAEYSGIAHADKM